MGIKKAMARFFVDCAFRHPKVKQALLTLCPIIAEEADNHFATDGKAKEMKDVHKDHKDELMRCILSFTPTIDDLNDAATGGTVGHADPGCSSGAERPGAEVTSVVHTQVSPTHTLSSQQPGEQLAGTSPEREGEVREHVLVTFRPPDSEPHGNLIDPSEQEGSQTANVGNLQGQAENAGVAEVIGKLWISGTCDDPQKRQFEAEEESNWIEFLNAKPEILPFGYVWTIKISRKFFRGEEALFNFAQAAMAHLWAKYALPGLATPISVHRGSVIIKLWSSASTYHRVRGLIYNPDPLFVEVDGASYPVLGCTLLSTHAALLRLDMPAVSWDCVRKLEGKFGDLAKVLYARGEIKPSGSATSVTTIARRWSRQWLHDSYISGATEEVQKSTGSFADFLRKGMPSRLHAADAGVAFPPLEAAALASESVSDHPSPDAISGRGGSDPDKEQEALLCGIISRLQDDLEACRHELENTRQRAIIAAPAASAETTSVAHGTGSDSDSPESYAELYDDKGNVEATSEPVDAASDRSAADDVVVVTAESGWEVACRIAHHLAAHSVAATPLCAANGTPPNIVRRAVAAAKRAAVVVLSEGALKDEGCVLALRAVDEAQQDVILLHDVESAPRFPTYEQMPRHSDGKTVTAFDSKAIVYLQMYEAKCFAMVLRRLEALQQSRGRDEDRPLAFGHGAAPGVAADPKADPIPPHLHVLGKSFRLFLSHRQRTGAGAVHRIHAALKADFRIFLDVESGELELPNLATVVRRSHTFLAHLSKGFFGSQYCVLELAVAVVHGLRLVFSRDYAYHDSLGHKKAAPTLRAVVEAFQGDPTVFKGLGFEEVHALVDASVSAHWPGCVVYHPELFEEYLRAVRLHLGDSDRVLGYLNQSSDAIELRDATGAVLHAPELMEHSLRRGTGDASALGQVRTMAVKSAAAVKADLLGDFCSALPKLTALHLERMELQDSGACALADAMAGMPQLQTLVLAENGVSDQGAAALAAALTAHLSLRELDLQGNDIGPEGTAALAEALGADRLAGHCLHNRSLQTLVLDGNEVLGRGDSYADEDLGGLSRLMRCLMNTRSLTSLSLRNTHLGSAAVAELSNWLPYTTALKCLDICHNHILGDAAKVLADTVVMLPHLVSFCGIPVHAGKVSALSLRGQGIGMPGTWVLNQLLAGRAAWHDLHTLNLCHNQIGWNGLTGDAAPLHCMLDALQNIRILTELDLSCNAIRQQGACMVAEAIPGMRALRTLNLLHNPMTSNGVQAVISAFEESPSLESLCGLKSGVSTVHPTEEDAAFQIWECDDAILLAADLEKRAITSSLRVINLARHRIGNVGAAALAAALTPRLADEQRHSIFLRALDLSGNSICCEGAKALATALTPNNVRPFNQSLQILNLLSNDLDHEGRAAIIGALVQSHTLVSVCGIPPHATDLDLSRNTPDLTSGDAKLLAEELRYNSTLQSIDLSGNPGVINGIECEGAKALAAAFTTDATRPPLTNTAITTLDVRFNSLGEEGAIKLSFAVSREPNRWVLFNAIPLGALRRGILTELNLAEVGIGLEGAMVLARFIRTSSVPLNSLTLTAGADLPIGAMGRDELTDIHLRGKGLGPEDAIVLAAALETNESLEVLDVFGNHLQSGGAKALADAALLRTKRVKLCGDLLEISSLDLSRQDLRAEQAILIAHDLKYNHLLTALDMSQNQLCGSFMGIAFSAFDASGVKALADVLCANTALKTLKLDHNTLAGRGDAILAEEREGPLKALGRALRGASGLTSLSLRGNGIGARGVAALADGIAQNNCLQTLDLAENLIEEKDVKQPTVKNMLSINETLETIMISPDLAIPVKALKERKITQSDLQQKYRKFSAAECFIVNFVSGAIVKAIIKSDFDSDSEALGIKRDCAYQVGPTPNTQKRQRQHE
ncbi:hypothetical protein CYMTET_52771 [Cymbomonas tetramitiformis]|uniref:Protein NLRC3 n=1 Tax=Cymbomonas tetramitiformis TaxID=36881 RepID=A0AAE0ER09_9CHLO|nr:hypothetical protein CYMTET_52771 [Cymbomonas tetramitiformis]